MIKIILKEVISRYISLSIISFIVISAACSVSLSSCIAGANADYRYQIRQANEIKPIIGERLREEAILNGGAKEQHFDDLLRSFHDFTNRYRGPQKRIGKSDFFVSYEKTQLHVWKDSKLIISEELPAVFNYWGPTCGVDEWNGQQYLMIICKSRSSTGLYYVEFANADGLIVFRRVMGGGFVWDVARTDNGFDLLSHDSGIRFTFRD